jgi:hypothetical protein
VEISCRQLVRHALCGMRYALYIPAGSFSTKIDRFQANGDARYSLFKSFISPFPLLLPFCFFPPLPRLSLSKAHPLTFPPSIFSSFILYPFTFAL